MKTLNRLAMGIVIAGYLVMSSGCIVEPGRERVVHDERWCYNHPGQCR